MDDLVLGAPALRLHRDRPCPTPRGEQFAPPLSSDELAFYDAVAANESAVDVQGGDVLAQIARELVAVMRRDIKTDWTVRDDMRAKLPSSIKRLLVKYKYPPDQQPGAITLVMEQMESMAPPGWQPLHRPPRPARGTDAPRQART